MMLEIDPLADLEKLIEQGYLKVKAEQAGAAIAPNLLDEHFSDYGNSRRLIALHGENLRYCPAFNKWLVYDTLRWTVDEGELHARHLSQATMLEFARQALAVNNEDAAKFAARCLNSARISNALREAQPAIAVTPADLDTHPDLLNCSNGTLNLRTGCLRPHRREDFITKLVHHDYDPQAECPAFLGFLIRITANHPGLIGYLQRAFGYSLTAHTIEKAVFLLHGRGDNGKSTLLTTFLTLLKEYAVLLQIDTLMVRQESNNTQADLADLRGARFVMTSETEEGQRLAEGKLKRITQGMGRIKATRKYENPIEFPETHKLWIDANHLPVVRGTDNAIWNRLHAVPFDVTIPKSEQDKELPAKLATEHDGILSWAVAGAAQWYGDRLGKPTDVEEAGQAWRSDSDQIGRFTQEKCVTFPNGQVPARKLYLVYKEWTQEAGEHPVTSKVFGERIAEKYHRKKLATGNVYVGICLTESE
jgi:putative DNA primase/helicase